MLWLIIRQSWKQNKRQKLLAVTTVFLAAGLISALLTISIGIGDKISREMKTYGANIVIQPAGQIVLPEMLSGKIPIDEQDFIDEKELPKIKDIFWRNNIIGFAPFIRGNIQVQSQSIPFVGTFFNKQIPVPDESDYRTGNKYISSFWKVTGKWPNDEKKQVLIGQRLASKKDWKIGQKITLEGKSGKQTVLITGILTDGSNDDNAIIAPLAITQLLLNMEGKVQSIKVSALTVPENALSKKAGEDLASLDSSEYDRWFCTAYVSSISHQLENAFSNATVKPIWQVAASEGLVIEKIQSLLFVVTFAALIAAAMGIASLMTNTIIERSKEIGLMKSLGAHNWQIYLLFYAESTISGLVGGALGCVAGWLLAKVMGYVLFGSALNFAWIVIPCVLFISIEIALIGTWFPAHRIARLYPIEVLYGRK